LREAPAGVYAQPLLTQNAAQSPIDGARESPHGVPLRVEHDSEPLPQAAEAAESAAMRVGSFTVPKPVDTGASRPVPLTQPAIPPAPAVKEPASRPKGRVPSLIERVTGVGRARVAAAESAPRPPAQPAKQVGQPRLTPLDPDDRPSLSKEEDLLDIPAFLRRQAN
jgi:cell division protein FtsZ